MLLMDERRELIREELISHGTVYVSDLAKKYSVTYETIRKDLAFLEEKGILIKSHGGGTLKQAIFEYPFQVREKENISLKKAIAKRAIDIIPENSSIIIGTGSTTLELAKLVSFKSGLKIFTDSLPVASLLIQSKNQVFLFGGELREKSSSVYGGWTLSMINEVQVDMCFLGTDGFSGINGPTSPSSSDAFIDKAIIAHSDKKYILGDHTKFKRKSLFKVCDWTEITALISNGTADKELVSQLEQQTSVILT